MSGNFLFLLYLTIICGDPVLCPHIEYNQESIESGIVLHNCNPSTQEVEAGVITSFTRSITTLARW
jgi:hypothetical protein